MLDLASLSDAELLESKFRDLPIDLTGSVVERRSQRVFDELAARNLCCNPSIWLSEEWFNPDGVVGFGIPFYLMHPRLVRLERNIMQEAEGVVEADCLRILRHETGHAVDEAYQLFKTPEYRRVFGSPRRPYPTTYSVEPNRRDFVTNLNSWYAQAHPVEDFAETFAVWLTPKRQWRRRYRDWPALNKLEHVDRWTTDLAGQRPLLNSHQPVETLTCNNRALREHYDEKRAFYGVGDTTSFEDGAVIRVHPASAARKSPGAINLVEGEGGYAASLDVLSWGGDEILEIKSPMKRTGSDLLPSPWDTGGTLDRNNCQLSTASHS